MQFKEFSDKLDALTANQKIYFKPASKENLNAYHPALKSKIFMIMLGHKDNYKLSYITIMQELTFSKKELLKLFEDKGWENYTSFDLIEDYNEFHKK